MLREMQKLQSLNLPLRLRKFKIYWHHYNILSISLSLLFLYITQRFHSCCLFATITLSKTIEIYYFLTIFKT
jgi:hypothetical protein